MTKPHNMGHCYCRLKANPVIDKIIKNVYLGNWQEQKKFILYYLVSELYVIDYE